MRLPLSLFIVLWNHLSGSVSNNWTVAPRNGIYLAGWSKSIIVEARDTYFMENNNSSQCVRFGQSPS